MTRHDVPATRRAVSALDLVPFEDQHLPAALELSRTEGWPHRHEDWQLLNSLGHGVVALDGNDVVGTALATPFGPVAVVNMVIVSAVAG